MSRAVKHELRGVAHGLASNGHDHVWAICSCGWVGPFRKLRSKAMDDHVHHAGTVAS